MNIKLFMLSAIMKFDLMAHDLDAKAPKSFAIGDVTTYQTIQ
jgi:hypothetical protein